MVKRGKLYYFVEYNQILLQLGASIVQLNDRSLTTGHPTRTPFNENGYLNLKPVFQDSILPQVSLDNSRK